MILSILGMKLHEMKLRAATSTKSHKIPYKIPLLNILKPRFKWWSSPAHGCTKRHQCLALLRGLARSQAPQKSQQVVRVDGGLQGMPHQTDTWKLPGGGICFLVLEYWEETS